MVVTTGCTGEELLRQPVAGYVKLNGQPLASGAIMFYPTKNNDIDILINAGAMVKDGYFSLPRASGLIPGDYFVAIRAPAANHRSRDDRTETANDDLVARELIPARYNSETNVIVKITDNAIKEVTFHLDSH